MLPDLIYIFKTRVPIACISESVCLQSVSLFVCVRANALEGGGRVDVCLLSEEVCSSVTVSHR